MRNKILTILVISLLITSLSAIIVPVQAQTTWTVDDDGVDCPGADFTHPQDAVNAANPGDIIIVYPGTYTQRIFTEPSGPHWGPGDQYAPPLIVYKDNLTIKAYDPDPTKTIIRCDYDFWVNKAGGIGSGGSIEHSTGGVWNASTESWDGDCVRPNTGTPPNAIDIIASSVTIEGFTVQRPYNSSIGGHDTIFIGGLYAGYGKHGETDVGTYGNNTIRNCVINGDSATAIEIWHSSNNLIENCEIYDISWRAVQVYTGWSDDEVTIGPGSQNNTFRGNEIYDSWGGIFVGAWNTAPGTTGIRTDNSGTTIEDNHLHDLNDFAVGFAFTDSEEVEIKGNTVENCVWGIMSDTAGGVSSTFKNLIIKGNTIEEIFPVWGTAIWNSDGVKILSNRYLNNAYGIITINTKNVEAHCNFITGTGTIGENYGHYPAFLNVPGEGEEYIVDARWNWWGSINGPNHTSTWSYMGTTIGPNPSSGDEVSDYILYEPWKGLAYIDIKPGSRPNSINLKSKGVVPVAILGNEFFDVSTIIPDTIDFEEAQPVRWSMEDINQDGYIDMVLHFKTQDIDLDGDSTIGTLTGETTNGLPFKGTDTVNIVPKRRGKPH